MTKSQPLSLISFKLTRRYFSTGTRITSNEMFISVCQKVLQESFGERTLNYWGSMLRSLPQYDKGFLVICTGDQFARFIINRYKFGNCINGIKDLEPEVIEAISIAEILSGKLGVSVTKVNRALEHISEVYPELGEIDFERRLCIWEKEIGPYQLLDVSKMKTRKEQLDEHF